MRACQISSVKVFLDRWRNTSDAATIPVTAPPSVTGSRLILRSHIILAASLGVVLALIVMRGDDMTRETGVVPGRFFAMTLVTRSLSVMMPVVILSSRISKLPRSDSFMRLAASKTVHVGPMLMTGFIISLTFGIFYEIQV